MGNSCSCNQKSQRIRKANNQHATEDTNHQSINQSIISANDETHQEEASCQVVVVMPSSIHHASPCSLHSDETKGGATIVDIQTLLPSEYSPTTTLDTESEVKEPSPLDEGEDVVNGFIQLKNDVEEEAVVIAINESEVHQSNNEVDEISSLSLNVSTLDIENVDDVTITHNNIADNNNIQLLNHQQPNGNHSMEEAAGQEEEKKDEKIISVQEEEEHHSSLPQEASSSLSQPVGNGRKRRRPSSDDSMKKTTKKRKRVQSRPTFTLLLSSSPSPSSSPSSLQKNNTKCVSNNNGSLNGRLHQQQQQQQHNHGGGYTTSLSRKQKRNNRRRESQKRKLKYSCNLSNSFTLELSQSTSCQHLAVDQTNQSDELIQGEGERVLLSPETTPIQIEASKDISSEVPPLMFELPTSDENITISSNNNTPNSQQLDSFRSLANTDHWVTTREVEEEESQVSSSSIQKKHPNHGFTIGFGIDLSQLSQLSSNDDDDVIGDLMMTDRSNGLILRSPPATERRPHRHRQFLESYESMSSNGGNDDHQQKQKQRPATARPNFQSQSSTTNNKPSATSHFHQHLNHKDCFSTPVATTTQLNLKLGKCLTASLLCSPRDEPQHQRGNRR